MMKFLLSIIFLLHIFQLNAQNSKEELLKYVLEKNSLKTYRNAIVSKLDTASVEFVLKDLKSNKKHFKSIHTNEKISLTHKEKTYLINSIRSQYKKNWLQEDFEGMRIINPEQIKEFTEENKLNGYINISDPIFIRNGSIALIYFVNLYGDLSKSGGGINDLSFYRLKNEKWEKWIQLASGIYN